MSEDSSHLGGNIAGGDPASFYPGLWAWLVSEFKVKTVLDIGCGEGHSFREFEKLGCKVIGVEGLLQNAISSPFPTIVHDLTKSKVVIPNIDLVWCCEVCEHIEERFVDNLLDTMCNGKIVAMTHALPKQEGHHHVNCQLEPYWVEKMFKRGYRLLEPQTSISRAKAKWYWAATGKIFIRL